MADDPTTEQPPRDPVDVILERLERIVADEFGANTVSVIEGEPSLGLEYGGQEFFIEVQRA